MKKQINDTGVRGFLKWLKEDQPGLYRDVAPVIAQRVPQAFSDHEQSIAQGTLLGFADDAAPGITTFYGDTPTFDDTSSGASTAPSSSVDVANAANPGAASPSILQDIAGILDAYSRMKLTNAQAAVYSQITGPQLQRAGAQLAPSQVSSSSMGIPFMRSSSTAAGKGAFVAVAGIIGLLIFLGRRGRA